MRCTRKRDGDSLWGSQSWLQPAFSRLFAASMSLRSLNPMQLSKPSLNWLLACISGLLFILVFPRFNFTWLAPFAPAPLLFAVAREPRPWRRFLLGWVAGVIYWFGVCYWIQFVLSFHGGMGDAAGWAVF